MQKLTHQDVLLANRDYYDRVAKDYRENERYAYSKDIILDVKRVLENYSATLNKRKLFLDFGCGSGFLSELIFVDHIFESATGIDISESQVDLYNKRFNNNKFRAILGDLTNLPYDNHSFDMAGCYSVLHHVIDYQSVVREVTRVLKPDGILYIDFEPNMSFRKVMSVPLVLRRKLFDKAPQQLDRLETIAEYHHNIENGINRESLINWLKHSYHILEVKPRFPQSFSKTALKMLSKVSWIFAPYFYIIAKKVKNFPL